MDVEILDVVRRRMRRFGAAGVLASILFGFCVELPFAEHEASAETHQLERSLEAGLKRSFTQAVHAAERKAHREHRVGRPHR